MVTGILAPTLEREHREIDAGIEAYIAEPGSQAERLVKAIEGLRRHIYLEEEFLFPPLREAGMVPPVFVMLREHGELWNAMEDVESRLKRGDDSDVIVDACRELLTLIGQHNLKEESVIYPQADAVLTAAASAELSTLLSEGRMPEDWVCSAVRPC